MQVLPGNCRALRGGDPGFSPEANLQAGTRYLSDLMQLFDNRLDLVLAAISRGKTRCCAMASAFRLIAKPSFTCPQCLPSTRMAAAAAAGSWSLSEPHRIFWRAPASIRNQPPRRDTRSKLRP